VAGVEGMIAGRLGTVAGQCQDTVLRRLTKKIILNQIIPSGLFTKAIVSKTKKLKKNCLSSKLLNDFPTKNI
jgi:hypothetical protein